MEGRRGSAGFRHAESWECLIWDAEVGGLSELLNGRHVSGSFRRFRLGKLYFGLSDVSCCSFGSFRCDGSESECNDTRWAYSVQW